MTIRRATEDDLAAIESFDEMGGDRSAEIAMGVCWVATCDVSVVAYASYAPVGLLGQPLLTYLCVHRAFRRRGLALALVQHIQSTVRGRMLIASTEDWCLDSQGLFEKLGWQKIGELSGINKDGSTEYFYAIELGHRG